jgi:uncharacterized protein involved in type VI secretion and phage assembly
VSYQDLFEQQGSTGARSSSRMYGVAVGIVTNNQDPDHLGRVKVKLPWLSDDHESNWARVAVPMAGNAMGVYFLPEVDDEVLVAFAHGRVDSPYVVGALWNGKDKPPEDNGDQKNNLRVIKSRSGHTITLDDTLDAEKIVVQDAKQKATITIASKDGTITIATDKDLAVTAKGDISLESDGDLKIKCAAFSVDAQKTLSIKASQDGKVEAQQGLALTSSSGVNINNGHLKVQ